MRNLHESAVGGQANGGRLRFGTGGDATSKTAKWVGSVWRSAHTGRSAQAEWIGVVAGGPTPIG